MCFTIFSEYFFLHIYLLYPSVRKQKTIVSYWLLTVDRFPSCIAIEAPINGKDQTPIKQALVTNPRPLLVNHSPNYFSKCWLIPWLDTNILPSALLTCFVSWHVANTILAHHVKQLFGCHAKNHPITMGVLYIYPISESQIVMVTISGFKASTTSKSEFYQWQWKIVV